MNLYRAILDYQRGIITECDGDTKSVLKKLEDYK